MASPRAAVDTDDDPLDDRDSGTPLNSAAGGGHGSGSHRAGDVQPPRPGGGGGSSGGVSPSRRGGTASSRRVGDGDAVAVPTGDCGAHRSHHELFRTFYPALRGIITRHSIANKLLFRPPQPSLYALEGPKLQEAVGRIPPWRVVNDTLTAMRLTGCSEAARYIEHVASLQKTVDRRSVPCGAGSSALDTPEGARVPPTVPGTAGSPTSAVAAPLTESSSAGGPPPPSGIVPQPGTAAAAPQATTPLPRPTVRRQVEAMADMLAFIAAPAPPPITAWMLRRQVVTPAPSVVLVPWEEDAADAAATGSGGGSAGRRYRRRSGGAAGSSHGGGGCGTGDSEFHATRASRRPSDLPPRPGTSAHADPTPPLPRPPQLHNATPGAAGRPRAYTGSGEYADSKDEAACASIPTLMCGPPGSQSVTLYCHGNAADLGMIAHVVQAHAATCNTFTVAVDYPGYGMATSGPYAADEGPSDEACVAASLRVLRFLLSTPVSALSVAPTTMHESTVGGEVTTEGDLSETVRSKSQSSPPHSPALTSGGRPPPGQRGSGAHYNPPGFRSDSGSDHEHTSAHSNVSHLHMPPAAGSGGLEGSSHGGGVGGAGGDGGSSASDAPAVGPPTGVEGVEWARSSASREAGRPCSTSGGAASNPALEGHGGSRTDEFGHSIISSNETMPSHRPVSLDRVVLYGQSIGTGIVMQLLRLIRHGAVADLDSRRTVCAVVLHSPFTSIKGITQGAEEADGALVEQAVAAAARDLTASASPSTEEADQSILQKLSAARDNRAIRKAKGGNERFMCDQPWLKYAETMLADRLRSIDTILEAYEDPRGPRLPPFLVVHGEDDTLIPVTHTLLLARAILHCPCAASDDARGRVAVAIKPLSGHNDVLLLETKGSFYADLVEQRVAGAYMRADGTPEPLPPTLLGAFDRRAVPHAIGTELHERVIARIATRYKVQGVAWVTAAAVLLVFGAVALPVVMYADDAAVGVCQSTAVVGHFGPHAIGAVLRMALGALANGVPLLGFENAGIHRNIDETNKRAAIVQHIFNLINGVMIVLAVAFAPYDLVEALKGIDGEADGMGAACAWVAMVPAALSIVNGLLGLWIMARLVVVNH